MFRNKNATLSASLMGLRSARRCPNFVVLSFGVSCSKHPGLASREIFYPLAVMFVFIVTGSSVSSLASLRPMRRT